MRPDNYVQDPYNTQNFNRFGYVLNNPLLYTDPSGEIAHVVVAMLIGAAVGVLTTAISNLSNGIPFWHGIGKAAVIGAVSGAISFGIGEVTQGFSVITKAALQAGMHGIKGGIMSAIEGGDFGSGFLAGAVSSLVSSGIEALGTDFGASATAGKQVMNKFGASSHFKAVMIASGGLSGGLSSAIAGGDFWKGVREGLITSGLNHAMHSMLIGSGEGDPKKDKEDTKNKFYKDKNEAYKEADRLSHDENGNFVREVSGWETDKGYIVLDPSENTKFSSRNDQLKTAKINGVLSVEYNGSYQKILGHFHTHPILYNGVGGDSIGVSFSDLSVYTYLESYGLKNFSIIRNCNTYNISLTSNSNYYFAYDKLTFKGYFYNVNLISSW